MATVAGNDGGRFRQLRPVLCMQVKDLREEAQDGIEGSEGLTVECDRDRSRSRGQQGRRLTNLRTVTSGSDELERLLARMSAKDAAAFETLYAATRRKLFATVLPIVKRRHLAEEIVQEAYVRIWLGAAGYRSSRGTPMLWMIIIARNLAIDLARKPVREVVSDDSWLWSFPADHPNPLEAIEISEDEADVLMHRLKVQYALQALEPARRRLIIAAYIRGESRKQLSERYGVPVNTIKTWIRRALLEARANLQGAATTANSGPGSTLLVAGSRVPDQAEAGQSRPDRPVKLR